MHPALREMMETLQAELTQTDQDVFVLEQQLRAKREHAAYLRGRIDSYASIRADENPATRHGQE